MVTGLGSGFGSGLEAAFLTGFLTGFFLIAFWTFFLPTGFFFFFSAILPSFKQKLTILFYFIF